MAAKADQQRRGSAGTVDTDDDLEETLQLDMGVEAVAQLLALKAAELAQLQRTHDEYVKSSCEYERELEIEVDQCEKKLQQLEAAAIQLERDKSDLGDCVNGTKEELQGSQRRERMLQTQLEEMKWKIQRLEQANDELETSARIAQATIEDLQHKSETLLEQNVFLQHEKEELLKQLSSIIIAEVHPASMGPGSQGAMSRSASTRFSRKSSSRVTEPPPTAPVQQPCTDKELSVFNEVSDQVNKCTQDSKLNFQIPPRSSLSVTQQSALCKSKACQVMIGAVDDLDIPRCEATFDKKNVTLQSSLDKFVSSCDTTTPAPSPMKRRKPLESSASDSGSGSYSKKRRYTSLATTVNVGTPQQLVVLLAVSILSLGLLLP
ncbi:unnamed protein product [Phytophthora fragariaefolia]|uniref:Unnamed protein product n=1 Tax=Phytophthora fragariaefolia TaxID=1490495 RepID=A0A9W6XDF9_9STRA|nr:unnamed protein product [Phytophthora fragariaefolia]